MRNYLLIFIVLSILFFTGCATTSSILLDDSLQYPKTKTVQIINSVPDKPYHVIAQLETRGTVGQSIPLLLESMREEAKSIGANAIIPTEESREQIQQGLIYNPWLGGYQTIGGGSVPIVRGLAIVYDDYYYLNVLNTKQKRKKDYYFGAGINILPIAFNGIGAAGWFGYKKMRFNIEYFNFDIPSSFFRDNLENGKVDKAFRIGFDYFMLKNLSGLYFPLGFESWKESVGDSRFEIRAEYDMIYLSWGIGYLVNIIDNVYFDSRFSMGVSLAGSGEVVNDPFLVVHDGVSFSGMLGLGVRL